MIFKHCGILLAHWIERFIEMEDKWWTFWELNRLADDWKRKLWHSFTATASSRRSLRLNRWRDELFPKIYDGLLAYNAVVISAPKSHALHWKFWWKYWSVLFSFSCKKKTIAEPYKLKCTLKKDFNPFWIIKQTNHENPEGRWVPPDNLSSKL